MVQCKKCSHIFRDSYSLAKHMSRKKPCGESHQNLILSTNDEDKDIKPLLNTILIELSEIKNKITELNKQIPEIKKSDISLHETTEKNGPNSSSQPSVCDEQNIKKKDVLCEKMGSKSNLQNCNELECKFCKKPFHRKNLGRHLNVCRLANDPVRLLEIELGVEWESVIQEQNDSHSGRECKYCKKSFCRKAYLNKHIVSCAIKKEYHQKLLNQKNNKELTELPELPELPESPELPEDHSVEILNFGDTVDNVSEHEIVQAINSITNDYSGYPHKIFNMAADLIIKYDQLLNTKNPENKNLVVPTYNCIFAKIKRSNYWEKVYTNEYLDKLFKDRANGIYNKFSNTSITKTFKSIFIEIKHFSQLGFDHKGFVNGYVSYTDRRSIKSKFKVSKIN